MDFNGSESILVNRRGLLSSLASASVSLSGSGIFRSADRARWWQTSGKESGCKRRDTDDRRTAASIFSRVACFLFRLNNDISLFLSAVMVSDRCGWSGRVFVFSAYSWFVVQLCWCLRGLFLALCWRCQRVGQFVPFSVFPCDIEAAASFWVLFFWLYLCI